MFYAYNQYIILNYQYIQLFSSFLTELAINKLFFR